MEEIKQYFFKEFSVLIENAGGLNQFLLGIGLVLFISLAVFIFLRELFCWGLKINKLNARVKQLEERIEERFDELEEMLVV